MSREFDTITLLSPSGAILEEARLKLAIERLAAYDLPLIEPANTRLRHQRFAGTDTQRIAALETAMGLPQTSLIVCTRGGYGLTRILGDLPLPKLASHLNHYEHCLVGHSDVTVLQLALLAQGAQPYTLLHGPMACFDFGEPNCTAEITQQAFDEAVWQGHVGIDWHMPGSDIFTLRHNSLSLAGPVWGGNLAMICSLLGTPWQPDFHNGILILEDVNEPLYKVERMLLQLMQAGILANQQALALGQFGDFRANTHDTNYTFAHVQELVQTRTGVPVLSGFPFGHCHPKVCWFQGGQGLLEVKPRQAAPLTSATAAAAHPGWTCSLHQSVLPD
ncbi:MAG: hypothetical protein HC848_03765 [Limnobacter sp.]|nr:hypothetical protein [Limnobacter sp.]